MIRSMACIVALRDEVTEEALKGPDRRTLSRLMQPCIMCNFDGEGGPVLKYGHKKLSLHETRAGG